MATKKQAEMSKAALRKRFLEMVAEKLDVGDEAGFESFRRPLPSNVHEMIAEIVDIAGWCYPAFERLAALADGGHKIDPKLGDVVTLLVAAVGRIESGPQSGDDHFCRSVRTWLEDRGLTGGSNEAVEKVAKAFGGMVVDIEDEDERAREANDVILLDGRAHRRAKL